MAGIKDVFRVSGAGVDVCVAALTVDGSQVSQAHGQEVGPQATGGHLGYADEGEAGHAAKHESTQLLVDHGHEVVVMKVSELSRRAWTWIISPSLI